uniref:Uncharacterized protein n=1 Tax=Anguilla anguilla TaxID=7936 RepID=A0A0E9VNV8_ANGAN
MSAPMASPVTIPFWIGGSLTGQRCFSPDLSSRLSVLAWLVSPSAPLCC